MMTCATLRSWYRAACSLGLQCVGAHVYICYNHAWAQAHLSECTKHSPVQESMSIIVDLGHHAVRASLLHRLGKSWQL